MSLHRDFVAARRERNRARPTFTLRGETFACTPLGTLPAGVMFDIVAAPDRERDQAAAHAALLQVISSVIIREDFPRFDEMVRRPYDEMTVTAKQPAPAGWEVDGDVAVWWPVDYEELDSVVAWMLETYMGPPTNPSNGSSPPASLTGQSSRDGVSRVGSDQTSGRPPMVDLEAEATRMLGTQEASSTGQPDSS